MFTERFSYLLHGLFIMDLILRSIKVNNWSADIFKNTSRQWIVHLSPLFSHATLVSGYPFLKRMSVINTDCICHGNLTSNAQAYLQENNAPLAADQSVRTIVAFIINDIKQTFNALHFSSYLFSSSLIIFSCLATSRVHSSVRIMSKQRHPCQRSIIL